jgi:hypothetical protein
MRGMEGDADVNRDGRITVGEMHQYFMEQLARQAVMMNRRQILKIRRLPERGSTGSIPVSGTSLQAPFQALSAWKGVSVFPSQCYIASIPPPQQTQNSP